MTFSYELFRTSWMSFLALASILASSLCTSAASLPPDIVLVLADDLGWPAVYHFIIKTTMLSRCKRCPLEQQRLWIEGARISGQEWGGS